MHRSCYDKQALKVTFSACSASVIVSVKIIYLGNQIKVGGVYTEVEHEFQREASV